jgi:hypothetical protein
MREGDADRCDGNVVLVPGQLDLVVSCCFCMTLVAGVVLLLPMEAVNVRGCVLNFGVVVLKPNPPGGN